MAKLPEVKIDLINSDMFKELLEENKRLRETLREIMAMTHQRSNWTLGEIKAVAEEALG